ncbi:MAG: sigma-70 family RNA polymerase sigma factor [Ruminococcus sp.]|nr:sigma-70 family RNA polymerase sigma factor [Ruminococcus sp.]
MDNGASSYRRFLADENEGLSELIRDYNDGLVFYINSLVDNFCIAEELTEEVFAELVVNKPRYSGKSSFKTWLYSIARYIAIDYLKSRNRFSDVPVDEMYTLADEVDLERRFLREEQRIQLHRCLGRLTADYRQVLWLSYFEELSNTDIAGIMGKSNRQVENLLYRAKQALKNELGKEGYVYEEL